jgi:hypothetical protein
MRGTVKIKLSEIEPGQRHKLLVWLHKQSGVSVRQWGKLSGIHYTTIAHAMAGRRKTSFATLSRLASVLKFDLKLYVQKQRARR